MIRYFLNADGDTATAETPESAARLEAKGYTACTACTADEHRAAWAAENARRLIELRMEDVQAMRHEARRTGGANVVYPSGWKHE